MKFKGQMTSINKSLDTVVYIEDAFVHEEAFESWKSNPVILDEFDFHKPPVGKMEQVWNDMNGVWASFEVVQEAEELLKGLIKSGKKIYLVPGLIHEDVLWDQGNTYVEKARIYSGSLTANPQDTTLEPVSVIEDIEPQIELEENIDE